MKRGFSLIEVLVAVSLFGIGIAAIFQSFSMATRQVRHERHTTHALHGAEQIMESLLVRPVDDPIFGFTTVYCFDAVGTRLPDTSCTGGYTYSVDATMTPLSISGLYDLTCVASWKEGDDTHEIRLTTRRY